MTIVEATPLHTRPPYAHVEAALAAMIRQMEPGDKLLTEPALAKQLGVSRATLREVLRALSERGVLVRRHGVGTFVASRIPTLETGLEVLESLERMASRLHLSTEVIHLEIIERRATPTEVAGLGLTAGDVADVLAVNRVITMEGEPVADLLDVVPLHYLRKVELEADFGGSVLDVLLARGTPMLSTSRTEIIAAEADARNAARLSVKTGSALLKLVAQLYSYDERVVDYSTSYFVPGHFKFHVMRRVSGK